VQCRAVRAPYRRAVARYWPIVELLPEPARLRLLARVGFGEPEPEPMDGTERRVLEALPHLHTRRGPFAPVALPAGLFAGLQQDALTEGARPAIARTRWRAIDCLYRSR
jgi:hypothetical protein